MVEKRSAYSYINSVIKKKFYIYPIQMLLEKFINSILEKYPILKSKNIILMLACRVRDASRLPLLYACRRDVTMSRCVQTCCYNYGNNMLSYCNRIVHGI